MNDDLMKIAIEVKLRSSKERKDYLHKELVSLPDTWKASWEIEFGNELPEMGNKDMK